MNKAVGFDRVRVRHVGGEKHEVVWACVNCILTANESQFPAEDVKDLVLALVHVRGWLFSPFRRELNECDIAIHLVPDRFDLPMQFLELVMYDPLELANYSSSVLVLYSRRPFPR